MHAIYLLCMCLYIYMTPFFPFIETKVVMMMMSSVNFNPHGTKLTRVIMINYAHGVDRVS